MTSANAVRIVQFISSTSQQQEIAVIFATETEHKTRKNVVAAYPSAAKIVKVCGGWQVFENVVDYNIWAAQK